MPAGRALPEPGEPPTAGAWSPRRTSARRGRSEAKQAAEDGRNGDTARSGERHSMERRTTLADARRPPASARPSTRGSCARRARPSPAAHAPLAAAAQPLWRRGGRRGLRPPSLLRTHGRAPRARRPGSRRRHALEDPPGGSIADAAFAEAPSSARNAKGGRDPEARQARKGRNWHSGYRAPTGPLSAWTPEAARCTRSGPPPPTSTTSSSPAPSCGRTARSATPARDTRARATRPGLPAASPA